MLARRRWYFSQIAGVMAAWSSRAAMAAFWIARNWPLSALSFTVANAFTASGLPQTQLRRQPVILKPLDMLWSSTQQSNAPGMERMLSGLPVKFSGA